MKLGDVARNPLGIIGLFISLIYGFANWMLGSTANTLIPCERVIIIWFIVLFPVLILATFCYLVVKHHGKLYAPKDYNKDESFLQTLSPFDSFVRLSAETFGLDQDGLIEVAKAPNDVHGEQDRNVEPKPVAEGQTDPADAPVLHPDSPAPVPLNAEGADPYVDSEGLGTATAVAAPTTGNDLDLIEHAKNQKKLSQMKELFELTQHFIRIDDRFAGVDVKPDVKMGGTGVVYDAAAYTDSGLQCLEVKYVRSPLGFKNLLIKSINEARVVKVAVSPADFYLKLVIVYDWDLNLQRDLRMTLKSVSPMLQDFVKVELVPRSSVNV
jgi:hypothetical protein